MKVRVKNSATAAVMAEPCPEIISKESATELIQKSFKRVDIESLSPEQIRSSALKWYERQMIRAAVGHGQSWSENKNWIAEYLKEEIRQRLLARGWRVKK